MLTLFFFNNYRTNNGVFADITMQLFTYFTLLFSNNQVYIFYDFYALVVITLFYDYLF